MSPGEPVAPGRAATFSWADAEGRLCGLAHVAADGAGAALLVSTAEVAFAGAADVRAAPTDEGWGVEADGVFALAFRRGDTPPLDLPADGTDALEQMCAVQGSAVLGGQTVPVLGPGQVSLASASAGGVEVRRLSGWLADGGALVLAAARSPGRKGHDDDAVAAAVLDRDGETGELQGAVVADPRLSTTYDGEGRVRRVGLELWMTGDDEEIPRRAAGDAVSAVTLPAGERRLDCAWVHWRMEGRDGFGPYVIERAA